MEKTLRRPEARPLWPCPGKLLASLNPVRACSLTHTLSQSLFLSHAPPPPRPKAQSTRKRQIDAKTTQNFRAAAPACRFAPPKGFPHGPSGGYGVTWSCQHGALTAKVTPLGPLGARAPWAYISVGSKRRADRTVFPSLRESPVREMLSDRGEPGGGEEGGSSLTSHEAVLIIPLSYFLL